MKYDIKKDINPLLTIEKIKKILIENEILAQEFLLNYKEKCYSAKIEITDTNFFSLKTETNKEKAILLAYMEFIKQIQTQGFVNFKDVINYKKTDEKIIEYKKFKNQNIVQDLAKFNFDINKLQKLNDWFLKNKTEKNKIKIEPYVSCKNKKIEYLPAALSFLNTKISTFAADTYEEALVQALSEVVERYCIKSLILNDIKLPVIPKEVYQQYDGIVDLIKEIESLGYKITIKDASLKENFPTICVLFEDLKYPKNGIALSFGAHPYFPIALEKAVLKFLQILNEKKSTRENLKFLKLYDNCKKEKVTKELFIGVIFANKTNKHIQNILSDEADYKFNKNTWFFDEKITNKQMFHYLAKLILKYTDDIYIRNCSFLNFPTVQVYANDFLTFSSDDRKIYEKYYDIHYWLGYAKKNYLEEEKSIDNLLETCNYIIEKCSSEEEKKFYIGDTNASYFSFYCSILKTKRKYLKKSIRHILREMIFLIKNEQNVVFNPMFRLYQGFNRYFKLNWKNISQDKIKEKIEKQYGIAIYNEIIRTIETIDERQIFNSVKLKLENENFEEGYLKDIKQKLCEIYCDNPPNQNEIIKIIKKQNIFQHIMKRFCLKH